MLINYKNANIYQEDKLVLGGVDLTVSDGELVYIIGAVGSGKSSLLKSFYCELDILPDEAETAEVLDRDLKSIKRRDVQALRREMGIIFQDFQLLHDRTVEANLSFVLRSTGWKDRKAINERIREVLQLVGMEDKANCRPHELSGGEQQRVAIARALLNNPRIIIADEPTGNLDPDTAEHIVSLLVDITSRGTAVVMSTHNVGLIAKFPGKVFECKNGQFSLC